MFAVDNEDLVAVPRAFMRGGREALMAVPRRRWLGLSEAALCDVLDRLLEVPEETEAFAARTEQGRAR